MGGVLRDGGIRFMGRTKAAGPAAQNIELSSKDAVRLLEVPRAAPRTGPRALRCEPRPKGSLRLGSHGATPFGTRLWEPPNCNRCAWEKMSPMCLNIHKRQNPHSGWCLKFSAVPRGVTFAGTRPG